MSVSLLMQVPWLVSEPWCQKYETGLHWKMVNRKKITPTAVATEMAAYRIQACRRSTVMRNRVMIIETLATTQVIT